MHLGQNSIRIIYKKSKGQDEIQLINVCTIDALIIFVKVSTQLTKFLHYNVLGS